MLGVIGRLVLSHASNRAFEPSGLELGLEGPGSELRPSVGVNDDDAVGLASDGGGPQRCDGQVGGRPVSDGVTDYPVGEQVQAPRLPDAIAQADRILGDSTGAPIASMRNVGRVRKQVDMRLRGSRR